MNFDDGPGNGQPVRSNTAPRETTGRKSASFTNLAPGFFARGTESRRSCYAIPRLRQFYACRCGA